MIWFYYMAARCGGFGWMFTWGFGRGAATLTGPPHPDGRSVDLCGHVPVNTPSLIYANCFGKWVDFVCALCFGVFEFYFDGTISTVGLFYWDDIVGLFYSYFGNISTLLFNFFNGNICILWSTFLNFTNFLLNRKERLTDIFCVSRFFKINLYSNVWLKRLISQYSKFYFLFTKKKWIAY